MKIKQDDLKKILCDYLASEVLPKVGKNHPFSVVFAFALEQISDQNVTDFINKYEALLMALHVIDKNKEIDIDVLCETGSVVLNKYYAGSFDVFGYHIDRNDLEALRLICLDHAW